MIVGVHFHEVDEFLTELERDVDDEAILIERAIVRRTFVYRSSGIPGGPRSCSLVASYLSTRPGSLPVLVHVDAHAGYLTGADDIDEKTTERRDGMRDAIEQACERLGLDARGGVYEAAPR